MNHSNTAVEGLTAELGEYGLFEWLDLELEDAGDGYAEFYLPFDEKFTNFSSRTVHGGIIATVVDYASGLALRSTFEEPKDTALTTTDLNVRYVRPATEDIRVEAEVVRAGSSMGVTECEVTSVHCGERKVVATGGTSYRLFHNKESRGETE